MTMNHDELALDPVALAIQEQFLEERRAGKHPRLSVYALRYPAYAAALADLIATLPPDALAETQRAGDLARGVETPPESFPERLWNGQGVERALASIFGASSAQPNDDRLARVAEERGAYDTGQVNGAAAQRAAPNQPKPD
jgi:hypothetical protein